MPQRRVPGPNRGDERQGKPALHQPRRRVGQGQPRLRLGLRLQCPRQPVEELQAGLGALGPVVPALPEQPIGRGAWGKDGTFDRVHDVLRMDLRVLAGRNPEPTVAIIDSQSVKTTEKGGALDMTPARR